MDLQTVIFKFSVKWNGSAFSWHDRSEFLSMWSCLELSSPADGLELGLAEMVLFTSLVLTCFVTFNTLYTVLALLEFGRNKNE